MNTYLFLQLCAHIREGRARSYRVSFQPSNNAQRKVAAALSEAGVERLLQRKRRRNATSGVQVAIAQSNTQANAGYEWIFRCPRFIGQGLFNCSMHRSCVRSSILFDASTNDPRSLAVWLKCNDTIHNSGHLIVVVQP